LAHHLLRNSPAVACGPASALDLAQAPVEAQTGDRFAYEGGSLAFHINTDGASA